MMTKVTISLPDSVKAFVQQKIENEGYGTVSEYIRELIRGAQRAEAVQANKKLRAEHDESVKWNKITGDIHDPFLYR
ncbi:hypothetical protein BH10ACI3_BH10ACI3_08820 [soil metagenome]